MSPERESDRDFAAVDISEDLIPDLAMAIRSTNKRIAVENSLHVLEVDLMVTQVAFSVFEDSN